MNKKYFLYLALLLMPARLFAQQADSMTALEKYRNPAEAHKFLAQYTGLWNETATIWLSPGSSPQSFKFTAANKMLLGGRFFQSSQKGSMGGFEREALATLGQHTTNQKFTLTLIDNAGTGTLTLLGFWTKPFESIELFGDIPSPANTDVVHVRQVIHFVDKDHYVIQHFDKRAGQDEFKSAEYRFTRKKLTAD